MKKEIVNRILKKITDEWNKKLKNGTYSNIPKGAKIDKSFLASIKKILIKCPDDDGLKRVESFETGKVHLVKYEDIILKGLKGIDLHKYPVEESIIT